MRPQVGQMHPGKSRRAILTLLSTAFAVLLLTPVASFAFSPDLLPSMAIWTNFNQKIHEQSSNLIHEEDSDGDGVADFKIFRHASGAHIDVRLKPGRDGMLVDTVILRENVKDKPNWVYGFDKNGDGEIEMLVRGWFAEAKWDQMLFDSDRDGLPDRLLYDLDQNGVYDCMGVDLDADGKLDMLFDLDNKTGEVINETVGWVTFTDKQRREALPQLYYSFTPELNTLTQETPEIVSVSWDFGDGKVLTAEELIPGEHLYIAAGTYEVALDVEFKLPGNERVYKAWYGIQLPIEPPPPGPPPLTEERLKTSINTFFGACGFVTADERPKQGPISEMYPDVSLPEGAPVGNALMASAVAAGELDLVAYWWRSDAEADAFLDALAGGTITPQKLSALASRSADGKPFELAKKTRARLLQKDGKFIAAMRENGFIITISTNRTAAEAQRWTRLLYDILHPAVKQPAEAPAE